MVKNKKGGIFLRIQKSIFFFILTINVIAILSSIHLVSANQITTYENSSEFHSFSYDVNMPIVNNSNANRICTENFEYEENTNLSLLSKYNQSYFSCIVKSFNDIDFLNTNNTYKSKYCEVTALSSGNTVYYINNYITNSLSFSSIRFRTIIKPYDSNYIAFMVNTSSRFFLFYLNFDSREFLITNQTNVISNNTKFIPNRNTYEYIYMEYEPNLVSVDYRIFFRVVCYNQTGNIISQNSTLGIILEPYRNFKVNNFAFMYGFNATNKKCYLIANDLNFISDRLLLSQKAYINLRYLAYDIQRFYLTQIPFYTNELKDKGLITNWYYATTVVQNRYLRYKTNATIYSTLTSDLVNDNFENVLQNSFSMKYEIGMNTTTDSSILYTNFHTQYFKLTSFYLVNKYYFQLSFSNYSHLVTLMSYSFSSINDNRIIFLSEFKNRFYYGSLIINNVVYSIRQYINENYENISISKFQILNYEFKSLDKGAISNSINNTQLTIDKDIYSFKDRVNAISIYCEFTNVITIQDYSQDEIQDNQLITYNLLSSNVYNMEFDFERSSENGLFSISSDNNEIYGIFDLTSGIDYTFNHKFFDTIGNLYLRVKFYTSSNSQILLNVTIHITRFLIYSDHIAQNNLLINKALEIMLPLLIFSSIVIGFKSNSNSKWFGFIGMYVALFAFYLMEYLNLLFLILCLVMQTIALYIVIKHEKSEGI